MPKVKRPKKGWSVPKKVRFRPPRMKTSQVKRKARCHSCGQYSMKKDESRSEMFCSSCGVIA